MTNSGSRRNALVLFLGLCCAALVACGAESDASRSERPASAAAAATPAATAHYLANAGVLVVNDETKIVFDPLFRNDFGTYRLLPQEMERALFAGEPPFEGLDAVFISHYHEDHFSREDVLRLLGAHPTLRLYAPEQAVASMREIGADTDTGAHVFDRVTSVALEYKDAPVAFDEGGLVVEAVRIPHSGWPDRQLHVENIAFRVTLDAETTVVHLGDADTSDAHFAEDEAHWRSRPPDVAFPPYWYFLSEEGREVLERRIAPKQAIGVHVPVEVPTRPEDREPELREHDLFTEPGETREIP